MEKPSLEQVKRYFFNAKTVKCKYDKKIYDISEKRMRDIHLFEGNYWIEMEEEAVMIWHNTKGYAKILSYKNTKPKFEITKEQILELSKESSFTNATLNGWFPKAFETVLEVGKWYKCIEKGFESLARITDLKHNLAYGFSYYGENDKNIWLENADRGWTFNDAKNWIEATNEEVTEALNKEAVKRYKKGDYIKCLNGVTVKAKGNTFDYKEGCLYLSDSVDVYELFSDGVWAETIPTKTIKQAEKLLKELGHEFKIV